MIVIVFVLSIIKNCDFELGNLVNAGYTSYHMDVLNLMGNSSLAANRIKKGKYIEVSIHESDKVSIFLCGLSTLVRYRLE